MQNHDLSGAGGVALGHSTIDAISANQLSVSARNYEIWLSFLRKDHPQLERALRSLIEVGELSEERMEDLHQQFLSPTRLSMQLMETGSRIATEIADTLGTLSANGASTSAYADTLQRAGLQLEGFGIDESAIRKLSAALAEATRQMSMRNAELLSRLSRTTDDLSTLRSSLRQARSEALTDPLTGIANRRLFDQTLELRQREADEQESNLALLMIDIDHFKAFNDAYGHPTGDQVIRFVAAVLAKACKPDDLAARYGGEEFAMILPGVTLNQARIVAEWTRLTIAAKRLVRRSSGQAISPVTVSIGTALLRRGESVREFVARADACLYCSKSDGRNRVTVEGDN